ncbi:c-type cytochrome [Candidatus Methylacidiphilum infernorum]|uniref:Cytochrome c family protein n=2 Tax=Candidatus Methylacidiphilum infernorum TaxID=511746 RepID=B3DYF8_METI4|nr:cytochrome c [Candidatus Methylacidiphilum infernorum]ACD84006.1 Cytochrome c family protein [Methylacidiphilum infernorum V4]ANC58139.1 cytochrome c oxidase, cbb3-type, subunit III [Candidatus Methylacidiphilum infernorum]
MNEREENTQIIGSGTREGDPAKSRQDKVPRWFLLFSFLAFLLSLYILVFETGRWQNNVFDSGNLFWGYVAKEKPKEEPKTTTAEAKTDPMEIGREQYQAMCSACHQQNGMGMPGQYPPLANSEYVVGSKSRLGAILLNGLSGQLKINGSSYNGVMPGWKTALNDAKLAAVMTYIRNSWGNHADKVEEMEVKQLREKYGKKEGSWTVEELSQVGN